MLDPDPSGDPPPWDGVEARWERSIPLPELTPAFLEEHLAPWPDLLRRTWTPLGGGLRSLNLRSEELVVRIALPGRDPLALERTLLESLAEVVRVPRVLAASEQALVLEFVPHEQLPPTHAAGRRVGRAATRIHAARTFPQAGHLGPDLELCEPFPSALSGLRGWAAETLAGPAAERLGPERRRALEALWAQHGPALEEACAEAVLVHSDFKPTNVKWLPAEEEVLVLDWEFAWAGPALYDLGQLLRWGAPPELLRGLEEELAGSLPANWRRLAEVLDSFNLVGFLRLPTDGQRGRDVLARLDRTLAGS